MVATPIGNLKDITLRALEVLAQVDLIACEDTRRTARLLAAHGIKKPLVSYFEHNEAERARELLARLGEGAKIALVTDAGTPGISDPGYRLVRGAREAGLSVFVVPGASALTAALSVAGISAPTFCFEGFLPPKAGQRQRALQKLVNETRTMVFFEAPHRLAQALFDMATILGADREAAVLRELTKIFEEAHLGSLGELARKYAGKRVRGEATIIVAGKKASGAPEARLSDADERLMQDVRSND